MVAIFWVEELRYTQQGEGLLEDVEGQDCSFLDAEESGKD